MRQRARRRYRCQKFNHGILRTHGIKIREYRSLERQNKVGGGQAPDQPEGPDRRTEQNSHKQIFCELLFVAQPRRSLGIGTRLHGSKRMNSTFNSCRSVRLRCALESRLFHCCSRQCYSQQRPTLFRGRKNS